MLASSNATKDGNTPQQQHTESATERSSESTVPATQPIEKQTDTAKLDAVVDPEASSSINSATSTKSLEVSQSACVDTVKTASESDSSVPTNASDSLFPQSGLAPESSALVGQEMSQTNSAPLATDIALDILSLDTYKNDLFQDTSVPQLSQAQVANVPVQQQTQSAPEYNAPWIVTVSMFWNDLPAIMMNNQPFVRLVDIHKQILPAKDTGILKKRCQLMGIEVENCNEMQRYFLVQYGKAFNSKSTLIISQDNAKELIGYYVNPQPKSSRLDDHKSIIDHRREQLRRIALARRAAMRSQRTSEKKDDPREIKEVDKEPVSQETSLPR